MKRVCDNTVLRNHSTGCLDGKGSGKKGVRWRKRGGRVKNENGRENGHENKAAGRAHFGPLFWLIFVHVCVCHFELNATQRIDEAVAKL